MAGLTQKQLELENRNLKQIFWMVDLILSDTTRSDSEQAAHAAIMTSIAKNNLEEWTRRGRTYNAPVFCINYSDGHKGYELFEEEYARSTAEKKCWLYGGSYTIEEIKKDPQSCNSEGSAR